MKQSLKELINGIETPKDDGLWFKNDTKRFIEEAQRGKDWSEWQKDVFEQFFEKNLNCVAKLGNGQMTTAEKSSVKEHWMELAPHLKAIADSQEVPLWDEYNEIRNIIKKYTKRNLNVATNRLLAGLQPQLLCTECDITRINKLVDYLRRNTNEPLSGYDPVNWEKASHYLYTLFRKASDNKDYWNLYCIPYKLLDKCIIEFGNLPKKWLAYANREMFRHADALHEIGFICWTMHRTNFSIGDEVYLFMSDERRIRFKTRVVADNYVRGDAKYRIDGGATDNLTYKLKLEAESMSDELTEENLINHGFNGGRSLQKPMYNNPELFDYITPFFNCEESTRTYWLISSNDSIFRLEDCLAENNLIDWQGSFSPKIGDIVFVYRTKPIQRICYMMEVSAINIPYRNTINDIMYWGANHAPKGTTNPDELYHRLKLLKEETTEALHLKELQKQGMKGVPQGPRKLYGSLLEYIKDVFMVSQTDYDEIPNPEIVFEGAKKEIIVNRYERNREAREKCIAAHGCKCAVCGIDFEKVYGEMGRGFIHVHHIVPLSSIGKEYELNPVRDLVPVCPNCHAMLHRKDPPYKIEELKTIMSELLL